MKNVIQLFELCREAAKSTLEKAVKARDSEMVETLQDVLMRIDRGPVRAIIFGETSSGKSTIINALTGQITVTEAENVSTAVPTYIMGNISSVGRDNTVYRQINFNMDDGSLSDLNMSRGDFLINGNYDSTHTDPELMAFMGADRPHYRAILGNREMEKNCISLIDTPGTNAGESDTDKLFRELNSGFELLIFTMKSYNILDEDQKVIRKLFPLFEKNSCFDKSCLFIVSNDFNPEYLNDDSIKDHGLEELPSIRDDASKYFKEYFDVNNRLYRFSAMCARLKRADEIYRYMDYLPKNFSDKRQDSANKRQQEERKLLSELEDRPLEIYEAEFVRFKDDLFGQAKKTGENPAFIIGTVGKLYEQIVQSVNKLRENEIKTVEERYHYAFSDKVLPDFDKEELRALSRKNTWLCHFEESLPETDSYSLAEICNRAEVILGKSASCPGLVELSAQEFYSACMSWQKEENCLRQPDFGNEELIKLSEGIKDAKTLLEEYRTVEKEELNGWEVDFEQIINDFLKGHSYTGNYNCSEEEIWYCKGNHGKMDDWFLDRVNTDTLSVIYERIVQDYRKILEIIGKDIYKNRTSDIDKCGANIRIDTQYDSYKNYIVKINDFIGTHKQIDWNQKFIPNSRLKLQFDWPVINTSEPFQMDLIDDLAAFIGSQAPVVKKRDTFFDKIKSYWAGVNFGTTCALKISSIYNNAIKKIVEEYYQKLHDDICSMLKKNANDYVAAMAEPVKAVERLQRELEQKHEKKTLSVSKKLKSNVEDLKKECYAAMDRLRECVKNQKDEVIRQYSDGVKMITDNLYAQINERYSDIDIVLNEVSMELEELKKKFDLEKERMK